MMGLPIPKDITDRLDKLEGSMAELVTLLTDTNELLREQTEILRSVDA